MYKNIQGRRRLFKECTRSCNIHVIFICEGSQINKTVFQDFKCKIEFSLILRALGYTSNSAKFEITEINNSSMSRRGL